MVPNVKAKGVIVGAGRAGSHLHYGALKAAGAEIVGFVESSADLLESTTSKFGLGQGFHSLEEALNGKQKLDFVDICSNTKSHFGLAKLALENGCHVIIEKPITESLEELEALKELRNKYNRVVCAVHNHKFYPAMEKLRERVHSGELGQILFVHREMSFIHSSVRMMEPEHWSHRLPGGRLFEANPHNLYLLYGLIGEMELVNILPRKTSSRWPHARIDEFTASLSSDRAMATIHMSLNAEPMEGLRHGPNFLLVVGSKKTVLADYNRTIDLHDLEVSSINPHGYKDRVQSLLQRGLNYGADTANLNLGKNSGHFWLLGHFIRHITGMTPNEPVPFDEARFVQHMNLKMGMKVETLLESTVPS